MLEEINVRIKQEHGEHLELNGLRGVNVLCGKNSSGKTTIFKLLTNNVGCIYGVTRQRFLDEIAQQLPQDLAPNRSSAWVTYMSEQAADKEYIYSTDVELVQAFEQRNIDQRRFGASVDGHIVRRMLTNLQNDKGPDRVYIPAKRAVLHKAPINTGTGDTGDGGQLLNTLFKLKNSTIASPAWRLFSEIRRAFKEVTGGFEFDAAVSKDQNMVELLFKKGNAAPWTGAEACGQGLTEILLMVYWLLEPSRALILIEEPENHVHPEMQERLVRFANAQAGRKTTLISTHSPSIVEAAVVENVFLATFTDRIRVENLSSTARALADLGYSVPEGVTADALVLVEGPSDRPLVEQLLWLFGIRQHANVRVYPLGGDNMDQVPLDVFTSKYRCWALVDRDEKSESVRKRFLKVCRDDGVEVLRTKRYALENYIPLGRFREVFGDKVPEAIQQIDGDKPVAEQLGFSTKKSHGELARVITAADFAKTDVATFFERMRAALMVDLTESVAEQA